MQLIFDRIQIFQYVGRITQSSQERKGPVCKIQCRPMHRKHNVTNAKPVATSKPQTLIHNQAYFMTADPLENEPALAPLTPISCFSF